MPAFIFAVLFLLVSGISLLHAEGPAQRDLRITDALGEISLKTAEQPKQAVTVNEETPLAEGDVIETGPESRAELTIDGDSVFLLQPGSQLKLEKIFLRNTQLQLARGAVLAKMKPAAQADQGLILKLPTAVIAIRGTEFGAETGEGVSHVCVFREGRVAVAGAWGHEHVVLEPFEETQVPLSNVPRPPYKLKHFQKYRNQIPHVRNRSAYWQKNWKPIGSVCKQALRRRLTDPLRPPSQGFHHPPAPQPPHQEIRPRRSLHTPHSKRRIKRHP